MHASSVPALSVEVESPAGLVACVNEVLIIRFFGSFDDRLVVGGPGTRNMWQIPAFPLRTASRRPRDVKSTHLAQATTPLLSIIHRCTPSTSPPALLSKSLR